MEKNPDDFIEETVQTEEAQRTFEHNSKDRRGQNERRAAKKTLPPVTVPEPKEIDDVPMATVIADIDRIDSYNRPTAKVYDFDHKAIRKRRAVSLGLSELIIPPITKGGLAKYRVIVDPNMKDRRTGQSPDPVDLMLPGSYTLIDKYEADLVLRAKKMQNLGPVRIEINAEGREIKIRDTEMVEFINGYKDVSIEMDYRLYVFLELHPNNTSNKNRPNTAEQLFERTDLKSVESPAEVMSKRDFGIQAELEIAKGLTDPGLIYGYAVQFGIPVDGRRPDEIKADLRIAANQNPLQFYSMSKNLKPSIILNLHHALSIGIIFFDADTRSFKFFENDETIHVSSVSEDPFESAAKAILTEEEKKTKYDLVVKALNYWE
jgi:hypothetical protein